MLTGLVIAFLVIRFFPRARGSGVNQTKAALYIYDGYIPMSTVIGKFITSALAIGSGQSLGPGRSFAADWRRTGVGAGPPPETFAREAAAHRAGGRRSRTGRGIQRSHHRGAVRHRRSHRPLDRRHSRRGRAVGDLQRGGRALVPRRRAAVPRAGLSPGALRASWARTPAWASSAASRRSSSSSTSPICGRGCANYPTWTQYFQPAAAGLLIGLIGIKFPQVMGAGYSYMDQAMHEQYTWQILAMLGALKILTTGCRSAAARPADCSRRRCSWAR